MTRLAVISDIHGNLHALRAVIKRLDAMGIEEIVCLGDVVGYGPEPGRCLDLVLKRCRQVVRGNHEDAVTDPRLATSFNPVARRAIEWTRRSLLDRHLEMLRLLPRLAFVGDSVMAIHDTPVGPIGGYVYHPRDAARAFKGVDTRVCLVGHTHVPAIFEAQSTGKEPVRASDVTNSILNNGAAARLRSGRRYILNPGAVGQPRDGDPRASFGVLDTRRWTFTLHREEYDVDAARRATEQAGLPASLSQRLAIGA